MAPQETHYSTLITCLCDQTIQEEISDLNEHGTTHSHTGEYSKVHKMLAWDKGGASTWMDLHHQQLHSASHH